MKTAEYTAEKKKEIFQNMLSNLKGLYYHQAEDILQLLIKELKYSIVPK
jgi:hypothetical protein